MNETKVNRLLRGELAATETYQLAMASASEKVVDELSAIHRDHRSAANSWRELAHHAGVKPIRRSGVFGMLVKAVERTATFLGDNAMLRGLKMGEEHGIRSYQRALRNNCTPECEKLIRATLLPQTHAHIDALDRLLHEG